MTAQPDAPGSQQQGRWDPLIDELRALRAAAGTPSYSTLTQRLIEQRMTEGLDEHAARIAKSSVHDTFRLGRSRINERLVKELVCVMGADPRLVNGWIEACSHPRSSAGAPPADDQPVQSPLPTDGDTVVTSVSSGQLVVLAVACVVLNLVGREFVDFFGLPFYLDMVGTAVAAIALGPWRGAAVGAVTNIIGAVGSGWISLPFMLVNVAGALMWGYGVRRWGMGRTLPRFFALNVATALVCSAVAIPVILTFLGQDLRVGHDAITEVVRESIGGSVAAVGFSNVITSLGDKLVSGFVALVVLSALPPGVSRSSYLMFERGER